MDKEEFKFCLLLRPEVKKNRRPIFKNKKTGKSFLGKSENLLNYENDAAILLHIQKPHGFKTIEYPIEVSLRFFYSDKRKADLDNLISTALDCLQKAKVIKNDSQVLRITDTAVQTECSQNMTLITLGKLRVLF